MNKLFFIIGFEKLLSSNKIIFLFLNKNLISKDNILGLHITIS